MQVSAEENQVSMLDLLLVVAENIKLLVIGPLVIGLLSLLVGFALPQSFTSQAILVSAPAQAAPMMTSPLVLDPVINALNWSGEVSIESARLRLASQIKAVTGKDTLLRLDVTAGKPEEAQKIANLVIDSYLKTTRPGELDRADLEKKLSYAQNSLVSVTKLIERITSDGAGILNKPITLGMSGTSVVALGELQTRYLGEVLSIPRTLRGLSRDIVVQPPTLPTEAVAPKKGLVAVMSVLFSGFVLLLWVFARKAWTNTEQDPMAAKKQARLRAAMGFKSPLV
jgi:capsular polysaccharide biosynthesis protein